MSDQAAFPPMPGVALSAGLLEGLPLGAVLVDEDGIALACNATMRDHLGPDATRLLGRSLVTPPFIAERFDERGAALPPERHPVSTVLATGRPVLGFVLGRRAPGERQATWFEVDALPVSDAGDAAVLLLYRPITQRVSAERRWRAVWDLGGVGLVVSDADGSVQEANEAAARMLGYRPEEMVGLRAADATIVEDDAASTELQRRLRTGEADVVSATLRRARKDGTVVWTQTHTRVLRGDDGTPAAWLTEILDVDERVRLAEEMTRRAGADELTGLGTRAVVVDAARRLYGRSGDARIILGLVSLDHLRSVNDTFGHEFGDLVLVNSAHRLRALARDWPQPMTWGRFSGDEFAVAAGCEDSERDPVELGDRLMAAFRDPIELAGVPHRQAVSVGLATVDASRPTRSESYDPVASAFADADVALGEAKGKGSGRAVVYGPALSERWFDRIRMAALVRTALAEDRLELVYQPVVDLEGGGVVGQEALLRLRSVEGRLLRPGDFLPAVLGTELVVEVGSWVLQRAAEAAHGWGDAGPWVAVNVDARQLGDGRLSDEVSAVLARTGLPATRLRLEVTEETLAAGEQAVSELAQVRRLGVAVALDDFGTGWSSLARLRALPVDELKLDRQLCSDVASSEGTQAVVGAVLGLGRALRLDVVAEGIETLEQAEALRRLGVPWGQGFLFGTPAAIPTLR